eukprot:gnl/MRDRNA2_/MRDRNA2_84488_c0_seq2.p1 gnl/MRDRNA2_/MRDRNA2_84488_c0~~gnl/MRDRNA2_/MRDRNA2_84488_c0_seq2.p1  ORF type:complete len:464 (+),score=67.21 gnl/MRDRNA2_/MRDRNA2_84488_c0_seq2:5-1396(+)
MIVTSLREAAGDTLVDMGISEIGAMGDDDINSTMVTIKLRDALKLHWGPKASSVWKHGDLSFYTGGAYLPGALHAKVLKILPRWLVFPPDAITMWLDGPGPPHFVALHTDPCHNVYFQINGSKTFQLLAPWQAYNMNFYKDNAPSVSKHWRQIANKDLRSVHDAWKRFESGPDEASGMNLMPKISVTLQPGDVLVLPRGWWHTTMNTGERSSIAINFWLYDRQPFVEFWWQFSKKQWNQHEKWRREKEKSKDSSAGRKARASKEEKEEEKEKTANHKRLVQKLKETAPWLKVSKREMRKEKVGKYSVASFGGQCIRWTMDDLKILKQTLESKEHLSLDFMIRTLDRKIGNISAWDAAQQEYVQRVLGGHESLDWQPLDKFPPTSKKTRSGQRVSPLKFKHFMNKATKQLLEPKTAQFFGLFPGCLNTEAVLQPHCEDHFREVLISLKRAARCVVAPCEKRLEL